jgi:DNA-binding MurR/RpiR family transcriptional regulator
MSITELASVAGVDQSTVTRFASKVGLSGYPALARLCRDHLREQAQTVSRLDRLQELATADIESGSGSAPAFAWPLDSIAATDRANIVRTFARITQDEWTSAVEACSSARSVYVVGLRKCFAVAYLLRYLLGLIREDVMQVSAEAGLFPDSLRRIGSGDVCIAISIHRYARLTVQGLRFAKQRGATTIALTDNRASPLALDADIVFYVETSSVSVLRSLTAFTSIAQALAAAVALRRGTKARSELLTEEDVLSEFDVFAVESSETQDQE